MKNWISFIAVIVCWLLLFVVGFLYYPRWQQQGTEATLSWDVSGYYLYLPAFFIYKDAKNLEFKDEIMRKYYPTPDFQQAFIHKKTNNYVMKYASGQAVQYLPFFAIAHWYALSNDKYEADGFSRPYQFMISLGTLLIAFLGVWFLRKILLTYFSDWTTALTVIFTVAGTNYLVYAAINGGMTHNGLFTLYCLIIALTISFYKKPTLWKAAGLGFLTGLAALTRPTEILSVLIPLLWGMNLPFRAFFEERLAFFREHFTKLILAVVVCLAMGSIQLIYWKYAGNEWLIYSYQDQGFSWFGEHFYKALFSYRSGWLIYTPMMAFPLLGFFLLRKRYPELFWLVLVFFIIFAYIAFSWDIWGYGGNVGHRAMIQAYPILAFPFAAFIAYINQQKYLKYFFYFIPVLFIYYNLWVVHQAHRGSLLITEQMTKAYFWKILGTYEHKKSNIRFLDTDEAFDGERTNVHLLYENDFESDSITTDCGLPPIAGQQSWCLNPEVAFTPIYFADLARGEAEWVRASALFYCENREGIYWKMTQLVVRFYNEEKIVKERMIRVHRFLPRGKPTPIHIDVRPPRRKFNRVGVFLWRAETHRPIIIDNLKVERFDEKD